MNDLKKALAEFLILAAKTEISEAAARDLLMETFRDYDVNFFTLRRTKQILDKAFSAAGF